MQNNPYTITLPPSSAEIGELSAALDLHESRKWPRAVLGNARELVRFKEACAKAYAPIPIKLNLRSKQDLFAVRELSSIAYLIFKTAEHDAAICYTARLDAVMAKRRCEGDARLSRMVEAQYKMQGARAAWLAIWQARKQCERRRRTERKYFPVDSDGMIRTRRTKFIDGERLPVIRSVAL